MIIALRIALGLLALLNIFIGLQFLTDPVTMGSNFGIAAIAEQGSQGLSSIRADFTSFFWVSAACLGVGAWKRNATLLVVAAGLLGVVFVVRAISLGLDGLYEEWQMPMLVEAVTTVLALIGAKVLPEKA